MSTISTIYDDVLTALGNTLTGKRRIPNAYVLEHNSEIFLRDSYGLKVGPAAPATRDYCSFSRKREFVIVLTREVIKTEIQTSQTDTAVKAMLEDIYLLQKDFLSADQIESSLNIDLIEVNSFSGIEYFILDQSNFITTEIAFSIMLSNSY